MAKHAKEHHVRAFYASDVCLDLDFTAAAVQEPNAISIASLYTWHAPERTRTTLICKKSATRWKVQTA